MNKPTKGNIRNGHLRTLNATSEAIQNGDGVTYIEIDLQEKKIGASELHTQKCRCLYDCIATR